MNLPNSWVLGRSGGDLASRCVSPSDLTREVFDEGSDLPWEAGGLRILCPGGQSSWGFLGSKALVPGGTACEGSPVGTPAKLLPGLDVGCPYWGGIVSVGK